MKRGSNRQFGREFQQRKAFLKSLLTALVSHGKIRTTVARAKSLKPAADKLVTQAKRGTLASRRLLLRSVGSAAATALTKDIAPKFASRAGGYTRIVKLGQRSSDGSPMAIIEFVQ
ncbi:MAG: 50S ribosomal protein L17 [Candidatus Yanofskybacteria bacterium]|nr:50S ribosomal protein L17 [Candidatus Yanofskybacteria bacterium]